MIQHFFMVKYNGDNNNIDIHNMLNAVSTADTSLMLLFEMLFSQIGRSIEDISHSYSIEKDMLKLTQFLDISMKYKELETHRPQ